MDALAGSLRGNLNICPLALSDAYTTPSDVAITAPNSVALSFVSSYLRTVSHSCVSVDQRASVGTRRLSIATLYAYPGCAGVKAQSESLLSPPCVAFPAATSCP